MTRMERRRRRRRILRIKLATTAAVLAMTTASIVALTGGAAETVPEPTPQPPALQAEPVLLVAEHDSTYQPVQMTAEPAQEPEPVEEEDENEKIEAALLEQGYVVMVGTHPLVMRKTTLTADEIPEGHQFYHYLIDGAVYAGIFVGKENAE